MVAKNATFVIEKYENKNHELLGFLNFKFLVLIFSFFQKPPFLLGDFVL